jgi:hypothetical protein
MLVEFCVLFNKYMNISIKVYTYIVKSNLIVSSLRFPLR